MIRIAAAAAFAVILASGPVAAQPAPRDYVAQAAASDAFETAEARLALTRAHSPRVRAFAGTMLTDHAKSTAMIKAAVRASTGHNPAPPVMENHQRDDLRDLRATSPRDFDRVYMTQQTQAHHGALDLHRHYAQDGTDPELKRAAAMIVPVVEHHLAMADALADHLN